MESHVTSLIQSTAHWSNLFDCIEHCYDAFHIACKYVASVQITLQPFHLRNYFT